MLRLLVVVAATALIHAQRFVEAYTEWTLNNEADCPTDLRELTRLMNSEQLDDPWGQNFVMVCRDNAPGNIPFGEENKKVKTTPISAATIVAVAAVVSRFHRHVDVHVDRFNRDLVVMNAANQRQRDHDRDCDDEARDTRSDFAHPRRLAQTVRFAREKA